MAAPLLLAAGLDWLEAILPLLFVLFWIISQVRNLFRAAGGGRPAGQQAPMRPAPRPLPDEARREIAQQIEEFLRQSSGGQPGRRPATARRDQAPPPLPGSRPTERGGRPRRPPAAKPAVATPAPAAGALGSLGGHSADVARHVEDAFAHDLDHSRAGLAGSAAVATPAPPAVDIAALVRNPATLRQLVIVREVLERPVDRW